MAQDDFRTVLGVNLRSLANAEVLNPALFDVDPHLFDCDFLQWPQGFLNFVNCHTGIITLYRYNLSTTFFTFLHLYAFICPRGRL